MKNKQKQLKRKKKREVIKELLRKNLKDWNKLPQTDRGGSSSASSKTSA
ncbi:hypothetical protein [Alteribacillus sp. HJP-4]